MGGAQPLAATMNGAAALVVEVDPQRIAAAPRDPVPGRVHDVARRGAVDRWPTGRAPETARSIGLLGNAADVLPALVARGVTPDVVTDQTSAHDAAERLRAQRPVARRRPCAPRARSGRCTSRSRCGRWASTCARCSTCGGAGASCSTTATTSARRPQQAGVGDAFDIPGFVPEYIRPLFCEGKGPFRWAALSGDPADIACDRPRGARSVPARRGAGAVDSAGRRARGVPGTARAHLLARLRRARGVRPPDQRDGAPRRAEGADRHRPRSSRHRIGRLAEPRDRRHARRQRRHRATGRFSTRC